MLDDAPVRHDLEAVAPGRRRVAFDLLPRFLMGQRNLIDLPAFQRTTTNLNVVVETPRGTGAKLKYNPETDAFELSYILPAGNIFPFEFGFIPSTLGEDGDPLDILVLMDSPTCVGCILGVLVYLGNRERFDRSRLENLKD